MNKVLETTKRVVRQSDNVRINQSNVLWLVQELREKFDKLPAWPEDLHLANASEDDKLNYLFVVDSLNFCFWLDKERKRWRVCHNGREYTGYYALSLLLKKAFESGKDIMDASKLKINLAGIDGALPHLMDARQTILEHCVEVLRRNYNGQARNLILAADGSAEKLAHKIADEFPWFGDSAVYKDRPVYFLKRAQIFVADVWSCFKEQGIGQFNDIDQLTAFADYRLPQILEYFGVLEYAPNLKQRIQDKLLLIPGSEEEVEIRAATIWVVELIKRALNQRLNSAQIDWVLWNESQILKLKLPTHHRTLTVYY